MIRGDVLLDLVPLTGREDQVAVRLPDPDLGDAVVGHDPGLDLDQQVAVIGTKDVVTRRLWRHVGGQDRRGVPLGSLLRVCLGVVERPVQHEERGAEQ
jgi:hypothetical protein